ncbi:Ser-Thr-rich glycosyl-phosphatidyl-inositol-anchored membrane family-domain-containing protein [Paraphoma chrysanthemicola]|nr:Ser-Thr-rich glycosyl-phosphatidyl-inositol-anchored membrane family-domain-containing protein [Paraphoma chrysanthemicola]
MRFFEIVVSGAALISSAFAVTIDSYPTAGVVAGQTYQITYSPKDAPATFVLRKGASNNLDTVGTIGTGTGGTFSWTVDKSLPNDGSYALQVNQGSDVNYSGQFPLTGGSNAPASSASAALSSALASASAAVSSVRASASSVAASLSSAAASASISPSAGTNSTISSATLSASRTASASASRTPTGSSSGGPPQSTGAASALDASPLALIFGAVAAFAYLA